MDNKKGIKAISILSLFSVVLVLSIVSDIALAQDQNPPTTGKTAQNVTSTFGPNLAKTYTGNMTSGGVGNITK
jgi:hypothetical protein